jgi:hypothetical protein
LPDPDGIFVLGHRRQAVRELLLVIDLMNEPALEFMAAGNLKLLD